MKKFIVNNNIIIVLYDGEIKIQRCKDKRCFVVTTKFPVPQVL